MPVRLCRGYALDRSPSLYDVVVSFRQAPPPPYLRTAAAAAAATAAPTRVYCCLAKRLTFFSISPLWTDDGADKLRLFLFWSVFPEGGELPFSFVIEKSSFSPVSFFLGWL